MIEANQQLQPELVVAYVPAITKAYVEFYKQQHAEGERDFAVWGPDLLEQIRATQKDLRALDPQTAAEILTVVIDSPVDVLGVNAVLHVVESRRRLVMPDDTVSRFAVNLLAIPEGQVTLVPVFLRWDREYLSKVEQLDETPFINFEEIPEHIRIALQEEIEKSKDWWLQVSCVITNTDDEIMIRDHNRYVPSDWTAEIDGDISSQRQRGQGVELSNAQHAEAANIAFAARHGIALEGADMYVTTFPCPACSKIVAESGIRRIYFMGNYSVADGQNVLRASGIEMVRVVGYEGLIKNTTLQSVRYPAGDD